MSKKNMLFLSLIVACLVVGRFARVLWNSTTAKAGIPTRVVLSGYPVITNRSEMPINAETTTFRINPILGEKKN